ncbi:uncharacterized protein KY384_009264 [Bacidia gigantensis]|uniref:uncharacterized protein n=1 Tax=Bacidia gigantensis TaxID=2732470 RepID=UPI001D04949B|nr:uncharacterized protein KY384_009264 [Bacidia gigantensis]KAG8525620.1 hypothetical protein KY384_009264 [Bacidia gigantensis]
MSSDLERERDANRKLQSENKEFQMLKSRRAFVVVLIDADADDYMFREEFLNHPDGGQKAADEIAARIEDHMASDGNDIDVVIRAFANLKGLKTGVLKRGKMGVHVNPERFVQSFSQRSGMFDFVDVGDAKEGVDHKIRGKSTLEPSAYSAD